MSPKTHSKPPQAPVLSFFHWFPSEMINRILFYLTVPQLACLLSVSKLFQQFAHQALFNHFKRRMISPPRLRPIDDSAWVIAMQITLVCENPVLDMLLPEGPSFIYGGFVPNFGDYYLDQYTDNIIPPHIYSNYVKLFNKRKMPLPTKSLGFIFVDGAPANEEERIQGYPEIYIDTFLQSHFRIRVFAEEMSSEEDRVQYTLTEFDMKQDSACTSKVMSSKKLKSAVPFAFERTFSPMNKHERPVGSENMRFKFKAEFWRMGDRVRFRLYNTVLDWRVSTPIPNYLLK